MKLDEDGDYVDVGISIVYTYHFNDNSYIEYNCLDNEYYYPHDDTMLCEEEFCCHSIDKNTLAWKYFNKVLIDADFTSYAESINLSIPEIDSDIKEAI